MYWNIWLLLKIGNLFNMRPIHLFISNWRWDAYPTGNLTLKLDRGFIKDTFGISQLEWSGGDMY